MGKFKKPKVDKAALKAAAEKTGAGQRYAVNKSEATQLGVKTSNAVLAGAGALQGNQLVKKEAIGRAKPSAGAVEEDAPAVDALGKPVRKKKVPVNPDATIVGSTGQKLGA